MPYQDSFYYSRRPTIAMPAGQVLQIGSDTSGKALGLHPRLTGLQTMFNEGRLAIMQRTGYAELEPLALQGFDIWGTANPANPRAPGGSAAISTRCRRRSIRSSAGTRRAKRRARCMARTVGVPAIPNARDLHFASPNSGAEAVLRAHRRRRASRRICPSIGRTWRSSTRRRTAAIATLDRVATVAAYAPTVAYPNNGFAQALRAVAGAIEQAASARKVFWVQTGGFDTHAAQGANQGGATST